MISGPASFRASLALTPAVPSPVEQLRHLYTNDLLARALLDAAAEQKLRAWRETALATARSKINEKLGNRPPKKAVIEVFKKLHGLGVVRHVVGRSGHQTRVEWVYRSPSVAAVAAGEASEFEKWGQSEHSRRRRRERLARRRNSRPGEATAPVALAAKPAKKATPERRRHPKGSEPRVVLDLGCGVAVTWNRPRNPSPAEAEKFAKAVAATVQSLAGVEA